MGRLTALLLTDSFKQQAIVDNRAGAGGRVGFEHVANSAPDGYTLLLGGSGPMIIQPALYPKLPYNVQKDFVPITPVAMSAYVLLVHPAVPAQTLTQLIALSKSKPGVLNYASSGVGAFGHLAAELFQAMAKVKMVHVAYKGTSPGVLSVMTGETDLIFSDILTAVPAVHSGRLRAIAVTGLKRSSALPGVPTVAEAGLPALEVQNRYGVLAPTGTPKDTIMRLNAALVKSLQSAETRKRVEADGSEAVTSTPEEFASFIKTETERWFKVIKGAGIKPE
ncbi:MAG: tripartite tricarboxylate transporter substrate binding protein [Betaproteobacteria bacterium]|nr:tripartite tricarboxylate transporter substrate binding protein [Betaproteobacteria bacterium]